MISFRAQQERKDNIEGLAASQGIPAAAVIHRALDDYKPLRAYENKQRKENMENDHGRSTDKPQ
jgi:orotate phosphoribosyltransferase-like protein